MSTQHTSGPWQHGIEDEGYFIANGELRQDIAKCIRSRADADLIAAAPDLLEAAKAALMYDKAIRSCAYEPEKMASFCTAEGDNLDALYDAWISKASAAISKATGSTS
jgi:hypothetical protein